jgi:preprotein translocase subunit SecY
MDSNNAEEANNLMKARKPKSEYPFLLRRAPAIVASFLTLILGIVLLVWAAEIHDKHGFASGVLVNVGLTGPRKLSH